MIPTEHRSELGGNAAITKFSIESNPYVFALLLDNMYTDKIMAVIREWSTNALDACIDAGLPIKFDAHLPTILEPYFYVRDYGTGLSDEDMLGLYSTLGKSTKRESNEFNGVFGIGRGAGLAYAPRFQIDSYYNGEKISYLVSTDNGIPSMISLGNTKTGEPNGLKVQVNVQHKEFRDRAIDVYRWFDNKPNTNIVLEYPKEIKSMDGGDWWIASNERSRYNNTPLAIMGNVAYVIDRAHFKDVTVRDLLSTSIRLEVPNGKIRFTPGRETLSMDDDTIAYLTMRLLKVKTEAVAKLIENAEKEDTGWKQALAFNNGVSLLPQALAKNIGHKISGAPYLTTYSTWSRDYCSIKTTNFYEDIVLVQYDKYSKVGHVLGYNNIYIADAGMHFMVCDIPNKHVQSVQTYAAQLTSGEVILIRPNKLSKASIADFMKSVPSIMRKFGNPEYVKASDYTPAKVASNAGKGVITAEDFAPLTLYATDKKLSFSRGDMLSSYSKDITTILYVETSGYGLVDNDQREFVMASKLYLDAYKQQHKDNTITLVGVPKGAMKNIKDDKRFIPLKDGIKKYYGKVSHVDRKPYINMNRIFGRVPTHLIQKIADKLDNKSLATMLRETTKFYEAHAKSTNVINHSEFINKHIKINTVSPKHSFDVEYFNKQYPLLQSVQLGYLPTIQTVDRVAYYLNLEYNKETK